MKTLVGNIVKPKFVRDLPVSVFSSDTEILLAVSEITPKEPVPEITPTDPKSIALIEDWLEAKPIPLPAISFGAGDDLRLWKFVVSSFLTELECFIKDESVATGFSKLRISMGLVITVVDSPTKLWEVRLPGAVREAPPIIPESILVEDEIKDPGVPFLGRILTTSELLS